MILREAAACFQRPVILYSIGKDSSVLLHLARKAFYPSSVPFAFLHIDTTWKFREMIEFRDATAREHNFKLIVHTDKEVGEGKITPFSHGSANYTDVAKTHALRRALNDNHFDAAIGGARRDEERSRAKERIFSVRDNHRWDPKSQRPELWWLYNPRLSPGQTMRVFPLSNWTELDVWRYIAMNDVPVVSLYFAKPRPVVERDGTLIMIDDNRFPLLPTEKIEWRCIRFRTLGCYPLSGAVESEASSVDAVIREMENSRRSERQGRLIDFDQSGSMERKKLEGYF